VISSDGLANLKIAIVQTLFWSAFIGRWIALAAAIVFVILTAVMKDYRYIVWVVAFACLWFYSTAKLARFKERRERLNQKR
jgi:hypothetical protein